MLASIRLHKNALSLFGQAVEELQGQLSLLDDDTDDQAYLAATPEAASAVTSSKYTIAQIRFAILGSRPAVEAMNEELSSFLQQNAGTLGSLVPEGISRGLASSEYSAATIDS